MTVEQQSQESTHTISEEGARRLRYAAMLANEVSYGKMDPIGLEELAFTPGETGILPRKWNGKCFQEISTHPEAPVGLK
eukprot:11004519-Karenia_brevis.AAC.1